MAVNLSGLFRTNVPDVRTDTAPTHIDTKTDGGGRPQSGTQTVNLEPGQTVTGEIVGRNGNEVQIRIAKDVILNAKMEQEIQASTGQNVTFEVRSQSSGIFNLRPLFQNMSQESAALRALSQAGIEANNESIQMVFSMMSEGMSIGKESVQAMYQQVLDMPGADVTSIVQMTRLGIPVTPENVQQFEAYQNYEHQLLSAFSEVAEEIPQAVMDIFVKGGPQEANAFIDKLMTIFAGDDGQEDSSGNMTGVSGNNPEELEDISLTEHVAEEEAGETGERVRADGQASPHIIQGEAGQNGRAENTEAAGSLAVLFTEEESVSGAPALKAAGGEAAEAEKTAKRPAVTGENAIPEGDRAKLAELVRHAGGSGETIRQLLRGEMGKDALYRAVSELSRHAQTPEEQTAVKELFLSKEFQKVFQDKMTNQWTLTTPESVEKKEVTKLYERLNEQTRALTQALSETVKSDSPLYKSVQNIRENVDFMNQLNQMYAYVQLPLKWRGESAHGDLYVYTNKKNLAKKDGSVSAFLHLDMEHLGMVDVYVAMERSRINTNFYLADEASLALLEKNIDKLTKRLTEKGYLAETKIMLKEQPASVMEEIIKTDRNISVISDLSFDARA